MHKISQNVQNSPRDGMDRETAKKTNRLLHETKVMTLAVSDQNTPWSSPVYFVFHDQKFYFFSNEYSRHVKYAACRKIMAASIFNDADRLNDIYGLQMSGRLDIASKMNLYLTVVKKYITKFNFLFKIYGASIIEDKNFFIEKFKSQLYCFSPEKIFLSDNSKPSGKRTEIDITGFK